MILDFYVHQPVVLKLCVAKVLNNSLFNKLWNADKYDAIQLKLIKMLQIQKCRCVGCILLLNSIQIAKKLMKQVNDNVLELIMWIKLFGYYRNK